MESQASRPPADLLPALAPQAFANKADRQRLTPAAIESIRNIALAWRMPRHETVSLLVVSPSTWSRIRSGSWRQTFTQGQLTRISALVGIFKAPHLLFADDTADRRPRLANSGPLFRDLTPIAAMRRGGIPVMLEVRRYVDALRCGL